jgi:hypothetical protein
MRPIISAFLVAVLAIGPWNLPVSAATAKPLGVVILAKSAHLDSAEAVMGATVYSGDAIDTDAGGTLRLRVGSNQVYLTSSSAASFGQTAGVAHINVINGTMGFSSAIPDQLELETPGGILRGAPGGAAFGQVTVLGPQEMVISAFRGGLILDNDGELHTISEGKSYRVTIDEETSANSSNDEPIKAHHKKRRRVAFFILGMSAVMAGTGYLLYHEISESPSDPH